MHDLKIGLPLSSQTVRSFRIHRGAHDRVGVEFDLRTVPECQRFMTAHSCLVGFRVRLLKQWGGNTQRRDNRKPGR